MLCVRRIEDIIDICCGLDDNILDFCRVFDVLSLRKKKRDIDSPRSFMIRK